MENKSILIYHQYKFVKLKVNKISLLIFQDEAILLLLKITGLYDKQPR